MSYVGGKEKSHHLFKVRFMAKDPITVFLSLQKEQIKKFFWSLFKSTGR